MSVIFGPDSFFAVPVSGGGLETPVLSVWTGRDGEAGRNTSDDIDRRASYRLRLLPGRARIELGDHTRSELRDISAGGGSLVLASAEGLNHSTRLPVIVHLAGEPAFHTLVRVVRTIPLPDHDAVGVGVSFGELDRPRLGALSRFMVREYLKGSIDITRLMESERAVRNQNRESINRVILAAAIRDQATLHVFRDGEAQDAQLQIVSLGVDHGADVMIGVFRGDGKALSAGANLTFLLPGRNSVFIFEAPVLASRNGRVVLGMPLQTLQTGFRDSSRKALAIDDRLQVRFPHPHVVGRDLSKPARDLAARGIGLTLDWHNDLLFPGDRLPNMHLSLPDGSLLQATGKIRGMSRAAGAEVRFGVELLDFASPDDQGRWHEFVFGRMHPRVSAASAEGIDRVWEVYERSAYLEKWIPPGRTGEVRRDFKNAWTRFGGDSGRLLLLTDRRAPVGTIAANQSHPRTWLMHGLAVDKAQRLEGGREQFLDLSRELYSGIMYTLQHVAGCTYFLSYFQEGKLWNQRLYGDFVDKYGTASDQLYDLLQVYRRHTSDEPPVVETDSGAIVGPATAEERALVAKVAGNTLSPLLVDAFSLGESELDLRAFSADSARRGLTRGREIFVASENGEPLLAVLCESSSDCVSIFGLMNLCWTIPLSPRAPRGRNFAALMTTVLQHYRDAGASECLFFQDGTQGGETLTSLGWQAIGPGVRWLARVRVLPAWLAYLDAELRFARTT